MKKQFTALAILMLAVAGASAAVITTLPGEIDMSTFTDNDVKTSLNGRIVSTDADVYLCGPNQMQTTVSNGAISLYTQYGVNTNVSYAALALGYVGGGNDTTYETIAGTTIYFSMDFNAVDGEDGVPDFIVRLNEGVKNDRIDMDWTSTVDLGDGTTRYIFDGNVAGWSMPDTGDGDVAVTQFGVYVAMGHGQGFDFNQVEGGESLLIGEVTGLTLEAVPEPATFGMLGFGALITLMVRRMRKS